MNMQFIKLKIPFMYKIKMTAMIRLSKTKCSSVQLHMYVVNSSAKNNILLSDTVFT